MPSVIKVKKSDVQLVDLSSYSLEELRTILNEDYSESRIDLIEHLMRGRGADDEEVSKMRLNCKRWVENIQARIEELSK